MAKIDRSQIQVIIPYSTLEMLLDAPRRVDDLSKQITQLSRQIEGLHSVLFETIERLRELE